MKFGKLLKETTDGMGPELSDLFVRYKELKKHLKQMKAAAPPPTGAPDGDNAGGGAAAGAQQGSSSSAPRSNEGGAGAALSPEEIAFVNTLNEDLERFNQYFMDKEEDSVIKLQALSDRLAACTGGDELEALKTELVDFHGELVLLLHWSLLNYAAVVKILKKHDKRTGLLLRAPYLANVLQQPFYSTSVMTRLVKMAEQHINQLDSKEHQGQHDGGVTTKPQTSAAAAGTAGASSGLLGSSPGSSGELLTVDTAMFARTRMALSTWRQLCSNASTPSTVLPPSSDELVRHLRVRERWAKLVGLPVDGNAAGGDGGISSAGGLVIPGVGGSSDSDAEDDAAAAAAAAAAGQEPLGAGPPSRQQPLPLSGGEQGASSNKEEQQQQRDEEEEGTLRQQPRQPRSEGQLDETDGSDAKRQRR